MAITIRNERYIRYASGQGSEGVPEVAAEIDVDTSADLPDINGISGKRLHQGSTALIIKEGKLAILSGDGKWIDCFGSVVKG